jgi:threonine dehydrogenase-like Zn-dependent dehydrogenase
LTIHGLINAHGQEQQGCLERLFCSASQQRLSYINFPSLQSSCHHHLQEQEAFAKAASLDTHKALVHIFFAQRSTKKVSGVTDAGLKPGKVRKVAVIGGGLMGSGIATAGLLAGQEVIIKEVNDKFLEVCC